MEETPRHPASEDAFTQGDVLVICIGLPLFEPSDVSWKVLDDILRVASRSRPTKLDIAILLPRAAQPGRFVVHGRNGVYEACIAMKKWRARQPAST